jgi:quinol monooxygenase YgiN
MNWFFRLLMLGLAISMVPTQGAQAQGSEAGAYNVIYIEVLPAAKGKAAALLKNLGTASRKSPGNLRFDLLQRLDRTNHFAIIEAWKDKDAYDANVAAAHTKKFRDGLQPLLIASYDERPHTGITTGPVAAGAGARGAAIHVVTHVDVTPPNKDNAIAALQQLADPSRKEAGNLRYEALQQVSRPNHSTLVETWKDMKALEMHEAVAHTTKFRDTLHPWSGSLFDQRLYKALN